MLMALNGTSSCGSSLGIAASVAIRRGWDTWLISLHDGAQNAFVWKKTSQKKVAWEKEFKNKSMTRYFTTSLFPMDRQTDRQTDTQLYWNNTTMIQEFILFFVYSPSSFSAGSFSPESASSSLGNCISRKRMSLTKILWMVSRPAGAARS